MKIISGGQTGVDRAALDAAIALNIPHGGWCPKGRLAELGTVIPEKYQLTETQDADFTTRTRLNIQDSDGTLIFVPSLDIKTTDGTLFTIEQVSETDKPNLIIDLSEIIEIKVVANWIKRNDIQVLNVAGPRESQAPGIYNSSLSFLTQLFSML